MKILIVHNYYTNRGGEDIVFEMEADMLRKYDHEVFIYSKKSNENNLKCVKSKIKFIKKFFCEKEIYKEIGRIIIGEKPDIVHIHNNFPLINYSIYDVCSDRRVPVIQTLHNYRFFCPAGTFMKNGTVCEECIQKGIISSIKNKCYQNSYTKTAIVALFSRNFIRSKANQKISGFITLTEFCKFKFAECGIDFDKLYVKPNFINEELANEMLIENKRDSFIFVGRLDKSKGIEILLKAFKNIKLSTLKIIGSGPLENMIKESIQNDRLENVKLYGFLPLNKVLEEISSSICLIMPSTWYETFGRTIIEAFSCSVPVIASNLGAMRDLVIDNYNGFLFKVGDYVDLINKINLFTKDKNLTYILGNNAYNDYLKKYTEGINYKMLIEIYQQVINRQLEINKCAIIRHKIIKTEINLCSYDDIVDFILNEGPKIASEYICVCNVFSIMTAYFDVKFQKILNGSIISVPDGMPIVWALRLLGYKNQIRVDGSNLMLKICDISDCYGTPIFFYGTTEETLTKLEKELQYKYPNINICGKYSPPFRELSHEEDQRIVEMINNSNAKVVFVGIGAPKQEIWMYYHKYRINALMIGVGAAFDFIAGNIKRAPDLAQKFGLEWVYRLIQEPKRLWGKYVINNPLYILLITLQIIKEKLSKHF